MGAAQGAISHQAGRRRRGAGGTSLALLRDPDAPNRQAALRDVVARCVQPERPRGAL